MKITLISTTTHKEKSTSKGALALIRKELLKGDHKVSFIDAQSLHIVPNLSCYAGGKTNCAAKDAGEYRCWAHKLSHDDPKAYGGKDEMGVIYDAVTSSDVVIFATSVRWGSHSALLQKIIERLNTLENRASVLNEPNPLRNTKLGVVVTGHNAKAQEVASHLLEMFSWLGFNTHTLARFVYQKSDSLISEVPDSSDFPALSTYLSTDDGSAQLQALFKALSIKP